MNFFKIFLVDQKLMLAWAKLNSETAWTFRESWKVPQGMLNLKQKKNKAKWEHHRKIFYLLFYLIYFVFNITIKHQNYILEPINCSVITDAVENEFTLATTQVASVSTSYFNKDVHKMYPFSCSMNWHFFSHNDQLALWTLLMKLYS